MKLLFVTTTPRARGTERHTAALAKGMAASGHDVAAYTARGGFIDRTLRADGIPVFHGRFRNAIDIAEIVRLCHAIRRFRPTWLIGAIGKEYWPLVAAAHLTGTRLALFRHLDLPMKYFSRRLLPALADRFIVVSEAMRRSLLVRGAAAQRIAVLHNPLDIGEYRPLPDVRNAMRRSLGVSDSDIVIGFAGELLAQKGIFVLASALDQAMIVEPRLKMLWVGDGADRKKLESALEPGSRGRHMFTGYREDVNQYYQAMDTLAFPTITDEAFGRALIEAQACGKPVIASNLGGIPETFVPDAAGWLIPPRDTAAWRDALLRFARLPETQRHNMAAVAREFVGENFELNVIAEKFSRLLAD